MSTASEEIQPLPMSPYEHVGVFTVADSDSTTKPAVTSTVTGPIQISRASLNTAKKATGPPPGYKLIKRRKEDGTSITVMRKMTPEEIEMAEQKSPGKLNPAVQEKIVYKIITVRDSDGALIRVKRPVKPEISAPTPSSPSKSTQDNTLDQVNQQGDAKSPSLKDSELKSPAMSSFTNDIVPEKPKAAETGSPVVNERPIDMGAELQQQKEAYRRKRMQKFRGSLIRGFGTMLGSSVGHLDLNIDDDFHHSHEPAGDIEDGDIIDSDQSWSDDDDDGVVGDEHDHGDDDNREGGHGELKIWIKTVGSFTWLIFYIDSTVAIHFDGNGAAKVAINALAARAASAPTKPAPPPPVQVPSDSVEKEASDKSKITYKVTAQDLADIEKKAADKDLERPLRRHWANFTFYFMGSLSIVLPLLFVGMLPSTVIHRMILRILT